MINYIHLGEIGSTNDYAKTLMCDKFTVIRALRQTGGRGRGGNAFFSDHEGGLWVTVVSPIGDMSRHFEHNRAMSLAVLDTLKNINGGAHVKIKWPNDIYWGDRKICGILLENSSSVPNMLITGFGLNVNIPEHDFPKDLRGLVTSTLIETGREVTSLDDLLDKILARYIKYRDDNDQAAVHGSYSGNLYRLGDAVEIGGDRGIFVGVEADGRLRLSTDGNDKLIMSGTLKYV